MIFNKNIRKILSRFIRGLSLILIAIMLLFSESCISLESNLFPVQLDNWQWKSKVIAPGITWYKYHGKALKNEILLNINILEFRPGDSTPFRLDFLASNGKRTKTSVLCTGNQAQAGVNGGYFNMKSGKAVSYLKIDGKSVSSVRQGELKRSWISNAAIIISPEGAVKLEPARADSIYHKSSKYHSVMVTGPMLIHKGVKTNIRKSKYRNPRTGIGITEDKAILLITIDGRTPQSSGVSMNEFQDIFEQLKCTDAINLDGGGSTTMWLKCDNKTMIVNKPCDNKKFDSKGERPVANAVVIR